MKRYLIIIVALAAAIAGVAIGIAAARHGNPSAAKARASASPKALTTQPAAKATPKSADAAQPDAHENPHDDPNAIWFASNAMPMPPFLTRDLNGQIISTAALRGKVVLLSFWATWCGPCREELPEMIGLANRYKGRLQIIGISLDDSPPREVRAFAQKMGINYPVVMGSREMISEYGGVPALPTTFVADPQGHIVQKHVGLFPLSTYDDEIRALLGMPVEAKVKTFVDTGQIFLKNAANATELPGVDLAHLSPDQKRAALKRLNSENCSCGCGLTLAQCRINDSTCPVSTGIAAKVVKEIAAKTPRTTQHTVAQP